MIEKEQLIDLFVSAVLDYGFVVEYRTAIEYLEDYGWDIEKAQAEFMKEHSGPHPSLTAAERNR